MTALNHCGVSISLLGGMVVEWGHIYFNSEHVPRLETGVWNANAYCLTETQQKDQDIGIISSDSVRFEVLVESQLSVGF